MHQASGTALRGAQAGLRLAPHAWAGAARDRAASTKFKAHVRDRVPFSCPSTWHDGGDGIAQLHKRDAGSAALLGRLAESSKEEFAKARTHCLIQNARDPHPVFQTGGMQKKMKIIFF